MRVGSVGSRLLLQEWTGQQESEQFDEYDGRRAERGLSGKNAVHKSTATKLAQSDAYFIISSVVGGCSMPSSSNCIVRAGPI